MPPSSPPFKAAGVADKDIQTTSYQINTQYDYSNRKPGDNRPPKIVGYEVINNVRVTVRKVSDAGKVLDAGIGAGANDAGGIAFDLSDTTKAKAQTDALTRAVQNARSKADTLASAAGVTVYSIYSISETGYGMVRPEFAPPGGGRCGRWLPRPRHAGSSGRINRFRKRDR